MVPPATTEWSAFLFEWPTLPLEEPVLVFAIALAVFLIGPITIKRLGQPGIVGIVLLGAFLGPGGTGIVEHGDAIELLGTVGLIYLLFTVGLEMDLRGFFENPDSAALFGLASFGLPFAAGITGAHLLLGFSLPAAALLAAVFASHTLLAYPIINQYDITQNRAVTAVFGGILFTDTLALIVLALAVGAAAEGGVSALLLTDVGVSLLVLFLAIWFGVPPIARWFFQTFSEESYFEFLFVATVFFAAAAMAALLNIEPILGAFVAGIALNRLIPEGGTLMNRIEFVGNALFIPFFLLHVGMLVDFGVILEGVDTLQLAAFIIGLMFLTKWLAAQLVGTVQGYSADERSVIFGLSTGQAAAALAVTLVGVQEGLFGEVELNAVVLMLLVTAVVSPWLTTRASNKLALAQETGDDDGRPTDPRIILPLSHHADLQRRLLEFAFVFKGEEREEPVHVLTVVRPDDDTETRVAELDETFEEIREVGNEAEIVVDTETRINHNPASGIVRGTVEVRADMLIMGWDAGRSLTQRMFGTIIDQVLSRTRLPVLVARLGHPINTTERMFVVVPHGVDRHEGFFEGLYLLKTVADRVEADVELVLVGGGAQQYEQLFDLVEPELPATFTELESWTELQPYLKDKTKKNDLVTVLAARRGSVGYHNELHTVPQKLVELPSKSFVVLHLREDDPEYDRKFLRFD